MKMAILNNSRYQHNEKVKALAQQCDLFLVIGSSLKVSPASTLPRIALRREVPLIIINLQPTTLDSMADVTIHEQAGTILPQIITLLSSE